MENVNSKSLEAGELAEMPWQIRRFYEKSFKSERSEVTTTFQRSVNSQSNDFVYVVNKGKNKTSKRILLGLFVKSLSGSVDNNTK